jgi:hypothetical protein
MRSVDSVRQPHITSKHACAGAIRTAALIRCSTARRLLDSAQTAKEYPKNHTERRNNEVQYGQFVLRRQLRPL